MPSDFIRVDQTTTTLRAGALLAALASQLRATRNLAAQVKGIMDHNVAASDYTALESLFGVTAGNGLTVYNLVAGALAAINASTDAMTLIDRVG